MQSGKDHIIEEEKGRIMTQMENFRKEVNFRDLGGYRAADGRKIRNGLLYRSGALGLMNPEELAKIVDSEDITKALPPSGASASFTALTDKEATALSS